MLQRRWCAPSVRGGSYVNVSRETMAPWQFGALSRNHNVGACWWWMLDREVRDWWLVGTVCICVVGIYYQRERERESEQADKHYYCNVSWAGLSLQETGPREVPLVMSAELQGGGGSGWVWTVYKWLGSTHHIANIIALLYPYYTPVPSRNIFGTKFRFNQNIHEIYGLHTTMILITHTRREYLYI